MDQVLCLQSEIYILGMLYGPRPLGRCVLTSISFRADRFLHAKCEGVPWVPPPAWVPLYLGIEFIVQSDQYFIVFAKTSAPPWSSSGALSVGGTSRVRPKCRQAAGSRQASSKRQRGVSFYFSLFIFLAVSFVSISVSVFSFQFRPHAKQ